MSLPALSIRRPVAIAMLFLGIALLGSISFRRLPIDLLPDVAYPRLVVHTSMPGSAPAEVERFISERIEQAMSGVPGMEGIESVSREGISLVTVRFAWGTDMDFAALNVREKLDGIEESLPQSATRSRPTVLRLDPRSEPIMALSVAGDVGLPELKELTDQVLRRRLEQIDGVAQAAVTGGLDREIQVEVDPQRMEAFGVTLDDITAALEAANASAPGGTVRQGRFRYSLRTLGEFQTVEQIGGVPLRPEAGQTDSLAPVSGLRVADVATVTDGFRERESIARFNGEESVGLLIFKDAGENTVRVAERVEETLVQLREEYSELRMEVATSQATFVADAIDNVVQNLIQGGALAFLILLLFLRDVRFPIAIGLAIPISVIAAFVLMDAFGVTLNVMSLGGLALGVGMLVDNSIVVLENTFRHREAGLGAKEAATRGAEEVQGAITASTLTTIAVFGPIVYIEGVAGELFGSLSLAVAFSLLASLFVALTLLPTLAGRWGKKSEVISQESVPGSSVVSRQSPVDPMRGPVPGASTTARSSTTDDFGATDALAPTAGPPATDDRRPTTDDRGGRPVAAGILPIRLLRGVGQSFDRGFARFAAWYEGRLLWALENRRLVLGVSLGMLAATALVAWGLDRRFLPEVDQGEFGVRIELERGTPLDRTEQAARQVEALFLADPAVAAVFTSVGFQQAIAGVEENETGLHTAQVDVRLDEGESTEAVLARVRPSLAFLPPGAISIESGDATAIGRLLGGGEADLSVRVRGEDPDAALAYATTLEARLAQERSLANVRLGTQLGQPEIRVEIDRERAAAYEVEPARIASAIEGYMYGATATEFVDFDRKIPIVVRLPDQDRRSLEMLQSLRVDGIPLRDLVHVQSTVGPTEIRREGQARLIPVYADVATGGLEEAIAGIEQVIAAEPPPAGMRVEVGGESEEMQRSFRELAFAFGLALLLVFMILAAEFENFLHPFVILLSVPMGLVGAVLALWVSGSGFNTMSLIGIVVLAGIVDNDAVVKVDFINQMRREGMALREAILAAGHARLRPILMTTLTTLLGLLPMAISSGRGAELRAPLAIAVFGGLFSATALTLIVLPVLYEALEEGRGRLRALVWVPEEEAQQTGTTASLAQAQGD